MTNERKTPGMLLINFAPEFMLQLSVITDKLQYSPFITSHTRGIFGVALCSSTMTLATKHCCMAHAKFSAWHTRVVCHASSLWHAWLSTKCVVNQLALVTCGNGSKRGNQRTPHAALSWHGNLFFHACNALCHSMAMTSPTRNFCCCHGKRYVAVVVLCFPEVS